MSESSGHSSSSSNDNISERRRNCRRSHKRSTSRSEPRSKRIQTCRSESQNREDEDQDEFTKYRCKLNKKQDNLKTNIADSSRESISRAENKKSSSKILKESEDFKKRLWRIWTLANKLQN